MNAALSPSLLGQGLYPLPEAARLAQIDLRTARRWAEGNRFIINGERRNSPGVMPLALEKLGTQRDLTFAELLTLRLVRGFRSAGLGLRTIKRVAERAASDYDLAMPFVSRRFRTDGRKVFLELQGSPIGDDAAAIPRRERELIEVLTGQRNFTEIVEPFLFVNVDWQDDLAARWWPLGKDRAVILDPRVMFGTPRIAETSVPAAQLAAAVVAEGGGETAFDAVAGWYDVSGAAVRDAWQFETEWLAKAA